MTHHFWFGDKKFSSSEPRLMMGQIKKIANVASMYQAYEEHTNGDIPLGDGEAVDLTKEPHFWAAPPATMFG